MRRLYSWVRAVVAAGLIGVSGWTLYQNYIANDEDVAATTTTTATSPDDGNADGERSNVNVTGPLPVDRIDVTVVSNAPANPVEHLTDGDPTTTWACSPCVNTDSAGIGETITFDLTGEIGLESIQIRNGFPEGNGFLENNRIQRLQIDLGSGPQETTLPDTSQLVTIEVAGLTNRVTLTVLSIYQSTDGDDGFGISEVTLVGSYEP